MAFAPETPRIAPPDWEDFSRWAPVRPAAPLRLVPVTRSDDEAPVRPVATVQARPGSLLPPAAV
jgi:hypothetical protein